MAAVVGGSGGGGGGGGGEVRSMSPADGGCRDLVRQTVSSPEQMPTAGCHGGTNVDNPPRGPAAKTEVN